MRANSQHSGDTVNFRKLLEFFRIFDVFRRDN